MASPRLLVREPRVAALWTGARWSALAAVPLVLAWLVLEPASGLKLLWYITIPILPATFFISTKLWRGICPLATLNELGNRIGKPRPLDPAVGGWLAGAGLVLFHVMVPARRFVFNQDGLVLAITVVAVGGLAVALGALFQVRSGFCNALCPVLPVELLYGQAPLARMERARCSSCTTCTPRGCLDLAEAKAIPQLLGATRRTAGWLATPYGVFFAALPGFILGYNRLTDGPLGTAATVYATTLGWSVASYLVIGMLVLGLRVGSGRALPVVAAAAGGIYYWYAGPATATELGAAPWLGTLIRLAGIGLVAWWLVLAERGTDRLTGVATNPSP